MKIFCGKVADKSDAAPLEAVLLIFPDFISETLNPVFVLPCFFTKFLLTVDRDTISSKTNFPDLPVPLVK